MNLHVTRIRDTSNSEHSEEKGDILEDLFWDMFLDNDRDFLLLVNFYRRVEQKKEKTYIWILVQWDFLRKISFVLEFVELDWAMDWIFTHIRAEKSCLKMINDTTSFLEIESEILFFGNEHKKNGELSIS